jgi:phosphate transport system substrate-binding protein
MTLNRKVPASAGVVAVLLVAFAACTSGDRASRTLIQNKGSDTLVNVAQAWAENYQSIDANVGVAVSGGGSGTGIAALINGTVDLANASRGIQAEEQEKVSQNNGAAAIEHTVAIDAVVFFVNKDNPLDSLSLEQLACIYGEGGTCTKWGDVGTEVPGCSGQEIIRVSRQSNSGTYAFVREEVLGKGVDFKLGSRDLSGSKDVADLVGTTPCAIGYSGMGYGTDRVKALCVSAKTGADCVSPTLETAKDGSYVLARPLFMYTIGEPQGAVAAYLEWIKSAAGQKIVADNGFVPLS